MFSQSLQMPKKSQFSLKRKKTKSELEFDDLLCPLDEKPPLGALQDREKEVRKNPEVEIEIVHYISIEREERENLGRRDH